MRNLLQTDRLANVGPVFDHGYDPAMVEFQKRGQHHQRKKLMLGVVLAAEPAGVGGQRLSGIPAPPVAGRFFGRENGPSRRRALHSAVLRR